MRLQERPWPAGNLFLSQRQEILVNHLARMPITPNQPGRHEMREEALSSAGAQEMDTSGYEHHNWTPLNSLEVNAVSAPLRDMPFSPTAVDHLEMERSLETPFPLDNENNKAFSPTKL